MTPMRKEIEAELKKLLGADGKHSFYQMLPPCFPVQGPAPVPGSTPRLDNCRFEYLRDRLPISLAGEKVIDIGANIGYFTFRLACEQGANVLAYEPYSPHARAIELIREGCGLGEERVEIRNAGVGLREIGPLPLSKCVLLLNVLQHAGQDFDADLVPTVTAWRPYAVRYLSALRERTKVLCFQLGYTWLGHAEKLCADESIVDFTASLVEEAGWRVVGCGVIRGLGASPRYDDNRLLRERSNPVPLAGLRETWVSRLGRRLFPKTGRQRRNLYRFAQRPLWVLGGGDG